MGVIEKIKGWFSKKSPPLDIPSKGIGNISGLYIPKNSDIQKIGKKVNEIQEVIDNLPPVPDLSEYAKKNENNSFVPQSITGATPWMNFKFTNGKIAGSIQGYNDKFEVKGNYENLVLKSPKNVILEPTQNAIYEKAPTENNHIANKEYVDNTISQINLSDYYNKSEVDNKDATTLNDAKSYTDSEIAKIPSGGVRLYDGTKHINLTLRKLHLFSNWYKYSIQESLVFDIPPKFRGKKFVVVFVITQLTNLKGALFSTGCTYMTGVMSSNNTQTGDTATFWGDIFSTTDLYPGNTGDFYGSCGYMYRIIGVE